jgi:hypothetical protein
LLPLHVRVRRCARVSACRVTRDSCVCVAFVSRRRFICVFSVSLHTQGESARSVRRSIGVPAAGHGGPVLPRVQRQDVQFHGGNTAHTHDTNDTQTTHTHTHTHTHAQTTHTHKRHTHTHTHDTTRTHWAVA